MTKKVTASNALTIYFISVLGNPFYGSRFLWNLHQARRRFLDRMCSSFNNNHINSIKNYEKLMKERNKLLQDNLYDKSWLETIEERMVSEGILVGLTRIELIKRLNNSLEKDQNPVWPRAFLKIPRYHRRKINF
jgi:recombinational DNA repair ATPase RecF